MWYSLPAGQDPRLQRSFEFDTRSDRLARFLLQEVLPAVTGHKTPSGQRVVFSTDPNDQPSAVQAQEASARSQSPGNTLKLSGACSFR